MRIDSSFRFSYVMCYYRNFILLNSFFSRLIRHSSQEFVDANWRRRDEKKSSVEFEENRFDDSVVRIVNCYLCQRNRSSWKTSIWINSLAMLHKFRNVIENKLLEDNE